MESTSRKASGAREWTLKWAAMGMIAGSGGWARGTEIVTSVQRYSFDAPGALATQLSGLTYLGGKRYAAVGDQGQLMHRLRIDVDHGTGEINSFEITKPVQLRYPNGIALTGGDFEGIGYARSRGSVFIINEADSSTREFGVGGRQLHGIAAIGNTSEYGIFATKSSNMGLESMARSPKGGWLWTTTQNVLPGDGPYSTLTSGETIRIQRLTSKLAPAGQWAYTLDANDSQTGWTTLVNNNVSEMLCLPDGNLVVLERALGRSGPSANQTRVRLYEVGFAGATYLNGGSTAGVTPLSKTLLWETIVPDENAKFEALTVGPKLKNGDYSLLMLADNSGGTTHSIWALRLSGVGKYIDPVAAGNAVVSANDLSFTVVPEPACVWGLGIAAMLIAGRRTRTAST